MGTFEHRHSNIEIRVAMPCSSHETCSPILISAPKVGSSLNWIYSSIMSGAGEPLKISTVVSNSGYFTISDVRASRVVAPGVC